MLLRNSADCQSLPKLDGSALKNERGQPQISRPMLVTISADCLRIIAGWLTLTDLLRTRESSRAVRRAVSGLWSLVAIDLRIDRAFGVMRSLAGARLMWTMFPEIKRAVSVYGTLRYACARGWLGKARWLIAYGSPRSNSGWVTRDHDLLESACGGGHRATARWVANHFGLGAGRGSGSSREALVSACSGGHLAIAQWLADRFEFITRCVDFDLVLRAFRAACANGHLAAAQWLAGRFDICVGRMGCRREIDSILCTACARGHLAVVQWLVAHFCIALSCVDVTDGYGRTARHRDPLACALDNHHLGVVAWLRATIADQNAVSRR